MIGQEVDPPLSLADKIEKLFEIVRKPDGSKYGNMEVSDSIKETSDGSLSPSYLWQLRTGRKTNPSMRYLEALAEFFDVPAAYFFDGPKSMEIDAELDLLLVLKKAGVKKMAMRAINLSEDGLTTIQDMIEVIGRREQQIRDEKANPHIKE